LLYEAQRQRAAAGLYEPDPERIPAERRERLLFELTYPRVAHHLRGQGVPYPELGPNGEILGDLSAEARHLATAGADGGASAKPAWLQG
jgi:tRNA (guanosine-2'-O-)-methyltransferase